MEETPMTTRRSRFPEPAVTMDQVDDILRARVAESRVESAQAAATAIVDSGGVPGVVIVPGETVSPRFACSPGQLAVQASLQTRF